MWAKSEMHENTTIRQLRSFSFLVGTVFVVLGLWPFVIRGQSIRLWALILAGLLIIPGAVWPTALKPIYRVWMTVGHTLGWVNTQIILAVIFYVLFAPVAIILRLLRNDPLRRRLDPNSRYISDPAPATPGFPH